MKEKLERRFSGGVDHPKMHRRPAAARRKFAPGFYRTLPWSSHGFFDPDQIRGISPRHIIMPPRRFKKGRFYPKRTYANPSQKEFLKQRQSEYEQLDEKGRHDKLTECHQAMDQQWPGEWSRRKIQKYFDNHRSKFSQIPSAPARGEPTGEPPSLFERALQEENVGEFFCESLRDQGMFSSNFGELDSFGIMDEAPAITFYPSDEWSISPGYLW
jgi:hypothetical protein